VASFFALIVFYFLAEASVVVVDLARQVRLLAAGSQSGASASTPITRCPSCSFELEPAARFCPKCGNQISVAAAR
jgi:rRNA maturation endonuclease Nob1